MIITKPSSRIRDWGYAPGRYPTGPLNSVLDVPGVRVGQVDVNDDENDIHTGVTVILPRGIKNTVYVPCYAAVHDMNGMGEWTGLHQIREWGFTRAPIAFTNTVSVGKVYDAIWRWISKYLEEDGHTGMEKFNFIGFPTVGETFDGLMNDIFSSSIEDHHVFEALMRAESQESVLEGNHGGGTAMRSHGFKAGTGTSSRILKDVDGITYTVGVIVQNNYGSMDDLQIDGVPVGKILKKSQQQETSAAPKAPETGKAAEGSCLVLIITDIPLLPHQLRRIAQRAGMGLSQVSGHGVGRNFSGEFFMALSTANSPESPSSWDGNSSLPPFLESDTVATMKTQLIDAVFTAAAEATEEALLNSMTEAQTMKGNGFETKALPRKKVEELLQMYGRGYMRHIETPDSK
ncbi:hypothetical protein QQS21_000740 [Conoideocrella luteorostrata]|uniref:D-aminopeptidase n=1 Tax=Conoideocrella luteorostrata TaxID=1105319 RepID=A0AAJ0CYA5_9HYPO|nr:hypothetical protein QQS21_000740 [Conoideocrella luteorostrata]